MGDPVFNVALDVAEAVAVRPDTVNHAAGIAALQPVAVALRAEVAVENSGLPRGGGQTETEGEHHPYRRLHAADCNRYLIDPPAEKGEGTEMPEPYQYLFGPVPSRRLGRSLGVDLIPFKTCTMDCVYCQLGCTPGATAERREYVPIDAVLAELERWVAAGGEADHITLAGSGEPTLHTRFGEVLRWVKQHTGIASVLLTNGSLLHLPEVRRDAAQADKVKVTLSAWDQASFRRMHRPAPGITFDNLLAGERAFRQEFSGELSVEVFIVEGLNSDPGSARRIATAVESIGPDRIDLNTAVRPAAEAGIQAVSAERLHALAALFGEKAQVAAAFPSGGKETSTVSDETLIGLIRRHPATGAQLAAEFGLPEEVMLRRLQRLVSDGRLISEVRHDETYFFHRAEA